MRGVILPIVIAAAVNVFVIAALPQVGRAVSAVVRVQGADETVRLETPPKTVDVEPVVRPRPRPPKRRKPVVEEPAQRMETSDVARESPRPEVPEAPGVSPPAFGLPIEESLPSPVAPPAPVGSSVGRPGGSGSGRGALTPAVLLDGPRPVYPEWAIEQGIEGTLTVRMLVGRDGRVVRALVLKTSGYRVLDDAALAAVEKYRFRPAARDGEPVERWVEQEFVFRIRR